MPVQPTLLQTVIAGTAFIWLLLVAATVVMKVITGDVNTDGLLTRDGDPRAGVSLERGQLLFATVVSAGAYALAVVNATDTSRLPEFDMTWLELAGASNAIYLISRLAPVARDWFQKRNP
jgi:hypothetical protein